MPEKVYTTVIIGSGFGGQCAAIECLRQKLDDFVILERRDFVGGTWAQNSYPGAAVDVQSPLYSLSFEPYDWSQMFANREELQDYTKSIFDKYQLRDKTLTSQNVTQIEWMDDKKCWQININHSEIIFARFLINASGPLSTPVTPKIDGQRDFQGPAFHTNNWDHDVDLTNKNVAIIGSGASAAQIIPAIVDKVKSLHVFQRSPHWVLPRDDMQFKSWQRALLRNKWIYAFLRTIIYWSLELRVLAFKYSAFLLKHIAGSKAQKHLKQQVQQPELLAKLTPDYTIGCKRIILSSTLYPAMSKPNVEVHDKHDAIAKLTVDSVITQKNTKIPIDVLIYSTGYDATDGIISYPVIGKDGKLLADFWADYPRAYLGTSIPDFPNFFVVTGPNTGIGHTSAIFVIESQIRYINNCIQSVLKQGKQSIEVKAEAEQQYTQMIHQEMQKTVWHSGGCNSWYKSKSGKVIAMFPGFSFSYRRLCRRLKVADHVYSE
jgi:cation diffusion facilitator CzcD-associated flavoprotein CzcO